MIALSTVPSSNIPDTMIALSRPFILGRTPNKRFRDSLFERNMDYSDIELGEVFGAQAPATGKLTTWEHANRDVRLGFIRKVYGLLSAQLLATVLICSLCVKIPVVTNFVLAMPTFNLINSFVSLILLLVLHCYKNSSPLNLKLLAAWTLSIAFGLGFTCAAYTAMGLADIVVQGWSQPLIVTQVWQVAK